VIPSAVLAARHATVREALDALGADALIVTSFTNIRYLTNHAGSAGILVLTRDAVHLLVDFRYEASVRARQDTTAACPGLKPWPVPASYEEALVDTLAQLGLGTVAFEAGHVSVARHAWWRSTLAARGLGIELGSSEGVIEAPRGCAPADPGGCCRGRRSQGRDARARARRHSRRGDAAGRI
jgi:Xaa-Pro aminopeptidase